MWSLLFLISYRYVSAPFVCLCLTNFVCLFVCLFFGCLVAWLVGFRPGQYQKSVNVSKISGKMRALSQHLNEHLLSLSDWLANQNEGSPRRKMV
jgi:hypothetical protein